MPKRAPDARPPVAVGHVFLEVSDVADAARFFVGQGLRPLGKGHEYAVLELRGGTHLLLSRTRKEIEPNAEAPFDLMVDDIDAAREDCKRSGLRPSRLRRSHFHRSFTIAGPDGYVFTITSSHAGKRAV